MSFRVASFLGFSRYRGRCGSSGRRRLCIGVRAVVILLAELADPHLDDQREGAEVHDDGDDDVRDVLVIGRQVRQLQARDIEHRHEQRREDDADGVTGGEHRNRDAVEADGRERLVRGPEELCVAGEVVERSARRAQSAGRTEIMETLFGLRKAVSGSIELEGKKVEIKNPSDAVACGFALVPEDRRKEGLVLSHTIKENAILPISAQLVKNGIFNDDKAAHDIVEKNIQDLGVVADNMNQEIRLLSGGNQQKIVIAKWLNSNPKIFMFDEPTAGVDIVAKGEIISIIREFADKGGAVIFASSELAEMMAICDDIITIFDGKITGRIGRKELMKEEELQHAIQRK